MASKKAQKPKRERKDDLEDLRLLRIYKAREEAMQRGMIVYGSSRPSDQSRLKAFEEAAGQPPATKQPPQ